jgi:hypothetical protein
VHNPFLEDAIYCLRRASKALRVGMDRDSFYDAAIYYAFGMEKLFKAIVHDVNPVFLLEGSGFENAVCALYADRLLDQSRKKADKDVNRGLIPFQASMLRAAKFSKAVDDNIGKFTKLADIRGALAHRSWTEVDLPEASYFLLLTFAPMVDVFAQEMEFDPDTCFDSDEQQERLMNISKTLAAQENYPEYIKGVLAKHRAIWEARKHKAGEKDKAGAMTSSFLQHLQSGGPYAQATDCPCCGQVGFWNIDSSVATGLTRWPSWAPSPSVCSAVTATLNYTGTRPWITSSSTTWCTLSRARAPSEASRVVREWRHAWSPWRSCPGVVSFLLVRCTVLETVAMVGFRFVRGPHDGLRYDHNEINAVATIMPILTESGMRSFLLMPLPEQCQRILRGEASKDDPQDSLCAYERVMMRDGSFEWHHDPGRLDAAVRERDQPLSAEAQDRKRLFGEIADRLISRVRSSNIRGDTEITLVISYVDAQGKKLPPQRESITPTTTVRAPGNRDAAARLVVGFHLDSIMGNINSLVRNALTGFIPTPGYVGGVQICGFDLEIVEG